MPALVRRSARCISIQLLLERVFVRAAARLRSAVRPLQRGNGADGHGDSRQLRTRRPPARPGHGIGRMQIAAGDAHRERRPPDVLPAHLPPRAVAPPGPLVPSAVEAGPSLTPQAVLNRPSGEFRPLSRCARTETNGDRPPRGPRAFAPRGAIVAAKDVRPDCTTSADRSLRINGPVPRRIGVKADLSDGTGAKRLSIAVNATQPAIGLLSAGTDRMSAGRSASAPRASIGGRIGAGYSLTAAGSDQDGTADRR